MNIISTQWEGNFHLIEPIGFAKEIGPFVIDLEGSTKKLSLVSELIDLAEFEISNCTSWQDIDVLNSILQKSVGDKNLKVRVLANNREDEEVSYVYKKIFFSMINKKNYEIEIVSTSPCDLGKIDGLISQIGTFEKTNIVKEIALLGKQSGIKIRASLKPLSGKALMRGKEEEEEKAAALERIILTSPSTTSPSKSKPDKIDPNLLSAKWKSKKTPNG